MTVSLPTRHRPVIGATGRRLAGQVLTTAVGFRDAPVEAYFGEYTQQVHAAGGLPVNVPMGVPAAEVADLLDGLVLSGGGDVDPRLYGAAAPPEVLHDVDPHRDRHELDLLEAMLERDKPVLGVCRGAQLINVACGGTLIADLPDGTGESHGSYAFPRTQRRHAVHVQPGTLAHRLYGAEVAVNSFHHQAVDRAGRDVVVSGRASDGVAEVLEVPGRPVLGVQWHPECFDGDPAFLWLVETARTTPAHHHAQEAIA